MKRVLQVILMLLLIAYPFLIYFSLPHISPRWIALVLFITLGLRWLQGSLSADFIFPLVVGIIVAGLTLVFDSTQLLKWYPPLMSFSFLFLFSFSLRSPPTVIERIARATDASFTNEGIPYTTMVTKIWCLFFIINAFIAIFTIYWCTDDIWALYNGLISYILIGILLLGERLLRPLISRHFTHIK